MVELMEMKAEFGKDTAFENVVMGGNVPSQRSRRASTRCSARRSRFLGTRSSAYAWCCAFHAVDSSELVFPLATIGAFREAFLKTKPAGPRADHDGGGRRVCGVPECVVFASFSSSCPFGRNQIDYLTIAPTWRAA